MRGICTLLATLALCASATAHAVHPAIHRDVPRARGVVVLVHGGGWAGPDEQRQWNIDWWPGRVFRAARWDTVAIDYAAGESGLASVVGELRAALAAAPHGRVCVYGESSGGHLALLAAAQLPALNCVITLGAPTDLERWRSDAVREGNAGWLTAYTQTAGATFGQGAVDPAWEPDRVADRIAARVLLVGQADDHVLPIRGQLDAFAAVRPATEVLLTEPGARPYLHGSFSESAWLGLEERMRAFLQGPLHRTGAP